MSDPQEPSNATDEERWVMTTLNEAGKRGEPSAAQMARWSSAFRDALAENRAATRRRRVRTMGVAAAVVLSAALLLLYRPFEGPPPGPIADVNVAIGTSQLQRPREEARPLQAGEALLEGDRIRTERDGGLGLTYRQADVRLGEATEALLGDDQIELLSGTLYVDSGTAATQQAGFVIVTRLGTVSHLGTQYLVALENGLLIGAVREGRIAVVTDDRRVELATDGGNAELIRVRGDGTVERGQTATHGGPWAWVSPLSTGMTAAGRSAHEVLSWAARETGLTLQYADDTAAAVAAGERLSGSDVRLSADQVLRVVSTSTRLVIDGAESGTLRVRLDSEDDEDSH